MINVSREGGAVESSTTVKDSLYTKRTGGKVRLPPLSTRQIRRYNQQQEPVMQTGRERKPSWSYSPNISSPFISENLLTSTSDYKCPRSPSNLSLQFNFEQSGYPETAEPFEVKIDQVKVVAKNNEKQLKGSKLKTVRNAKNIKMRSKGYNILNNEQSITLVEKQRSGTNARTTATRQPACSHNDTNTGATTARQPVYSRNDKVVPLSPGVKVSARTSLRTETHNPKERKKSTYDLREFLSLPPDNKINSVSTSPSINSKTLISQRGGTTPVKLSSDDRTYNVFEFLSLPVESSSDLASNEQIKSHNVKEMRSQRTEKAKSIKSIKKPEIPSVIVADWSLSDDSPRTTKKSTRKIRKLPKTNFPSENFPTKLECHKTLATPTITAQRDSVYNLKEFLMLPEVSRPHSIKKVNPQSEEIKPRSNSLEADTPRDPDVKYDLNEFRNFLESNGGDLQVNRAASRERSMGELRNRSLSVYDVYEFLKVTTAKELSPGIEFASTNSSKPSIVDVTSLVAKSSSSAIEENGSQASRYNLREFLTLPETIKSNDNE